VKLPDLETSETPKKMTINNLLIIRAIRKIIRIKSIFFEFLNEGFLIGIQEIQIRLALHEKNMFRYRVHLSAKLGLLSLNDKGDLNKVFAKFGCFFKDGITNVLDNEEKLQCAKELRCAPLSRLLELYKYYQYFGDLRVANFLRQQALQISFDRQMEMKELSLLGLQAGLEFGKPDLVLELISQKKIRKRDHAHIAEIEAMAFALLGQISKANQIWRRNFNYADYRYLKYVEGKSIAVVGPAPMLEEGGSEIDSFDITIRTNYRSGSNIPVKMFGKRTSVSYYNGQTMDESFEGVVEDAAELDWVILKVQRHLEKFKECLPVFSDNSRTGFTPNSIFFHESSPMAIQIILSDLIRFSPKNIKLFNINFFASEKTYHQNYHQNYPIGLINESYIAQGVRKHDVISGLVFVQNLFRYGLCTAEHQTEKVLDLNCEQYAEKINNVYGEYPVCNI
jgi:hypothetical protein